MDQPIGIRDSRSASFILGAALLLLLSASNACRYYRLEHRLDPIHKEWLTHVKYIITSEERKLFLDLPATEKEPFKQEFWTRRDPDPFTEENEFKTTYEDRIESANNMFRGEPQQGYLTDRGRIHVLFGPPHYRETSGQTRTSARQEIWYYGNFAVLFVDEHSTGVFRLITDNLSSLQSSNLNYMSELRRAENEARQTIQTDEPIFNFDLRIENLQVKPDRIEFQAAIQISMMSIWFQAQGEELVASWEVYLAVKDDQDALAWEYRENHETRTNEEELVYGSDDTFKIQIPVTITEGLDRLRRGENKIFVELTEKTSSRRLMKVRAFKIGNYLP